MLKQQCLFLFIVNVILLFPNIAFAQNDTVLGVLTPGAYASIIKKYHPVIKQANIITEVAGAELLANRGAFDPQLKAYSDQKTFDGTNYYRYWNTELNIPTWYGINIQGGIQQMEGDKINPERTIGQSNYLGLSIPLGKNLILDRRRASLQQSKLFVKLSEQEKNTLINNLLVEAFSSYWTWAEAYQQYQLMMKAVAINEQRFSLVQMSLVQGDRAAIDTTEAFAQLQNFYYLRSDAYLKFKNATLELSNYLWMENNTPYQINESILPDTNWNKSEIKNYALPIADSILQISQTGHPKLLGFDYKLKSLEVERAYKKQNLLPELTLKSNVLGSDFSLVNRGGFSAVEQNYTLGIYFSLPIRLSEARGDLQKSNLKIMETGFDQKLAKLEIENKVRVYINELSTLKEQIILFENMVSNYNKLLRAEEGKFRSGESSLFIVNNRENKLWETNQKLISLKGKFFKTIIALDWASGQLYKMQ